MEKFIFNMSKIYIKINSKQGIFAGKLQKNQAKR
jgi:hypothetical protein